jgi:hypothetical protein
LLSNVFISIIQLIFHSYLKIEENKKIVILLNKENSGPNFGYRVLGAIFEQKGFSPIYLNAHDVDIKEKIISAYQQNEISFTLTHNNLCLDLKFENKGLFEHFNSYCISLTDTPLPKFELIKNAGLNTAVLIGDIRYQKLMTLINPRLNIFSWIAYNNVIGTSDVKLIKDRKIDVMFAGRVGLGEENLKAHNIFRRIFGKRFCAMYGFQNEEQINEIIVKKLTKNSFKITNRLFLKLKLNSKNTWDYLWNVVQFIRAKRRNLIIDELLNLPENINICIITDKNQVDKLKHKVKKNVTLHEFMPWPDVIDMMNSTKIVINVLPYQVESNHERISVAQFSGAVVLSDSNPYLRNKYKNGENLFFYDYEKGNLSKRIIEVLNSNNLQKIANFGNEIVKNNDMPEHRVDYIISIYQKLLNKSNYES